MTSKPIQNTVHVTRDSYPIFAILGCVLIVLKLLHLIDISWILVLAPFWIPWAIILSILCVIGIIGVIAFVVALGFAIFT